MFLNPRMIMLLEYSYLELIDVITRERIRFGLQSKDYTYEDVLCVLGDNFEHIKKNVKSDFTDYISVVEVNCEKSDQIFNKLRLVDSSVNIHMSTGEDYLLAFEKISAKRRLLNHRYFQTPMLPESTMRKAEFITDRLKPNRILLIGDDDLLSVALNMLNPQLAIDVIEIDQWLCKFLTSELSGRQGIRVFNQSIFDSIRHVKNNYYDVACAETISAYEPMIVFLAKAMDATTKEGFIIFPPVSNGSTNRLVKKISTLLDLKIVARSNRFGFYLDEYFDLAQFSTDLVVAQKASEHIHIKLGDNCRNCMNLYLKKKGGE